MDLPWRALNTTMAALNPGHHMSDKLSPSKLRILVAFLLAASVTMIGGAVWMIATDQGAPVVVALGGSMFAAFAAVIASQLKKKS